MSAIAMKKALLIFVIILSLAACNRSRSPQDQASDAEQQRQSATSQNGQNVVLSINKTQYTNGDLKAFIKIRYADISQPDDNSSLLSRIFDLFVEQKMFLFEASKYDIPVSQDEIREYTKNVPTENLAELSNTVKDMIRLQKFLYTIVYKDISVSDREVEIYYQANLNEFKHNEEIQLYHIMVADKETALQIQSELAAQPYKFDDIARTRSIAPEKEQHGLMGSFEKGGLPKEIEDRVFALQVGQISGVIETPPYGFHIFKVMQKKKPRLMLMTKVQEEIRAKLLSEKFSQAYGAFYDKLKKELTVNRHIDRLFFKYNLINNGENAHETSSVPPSTEHPAPDPGN
jgi:peptidyl-prolyl cis-trans isomerase C